MFGLLLILILMIWAVFYHPSIKETGDLPTKITNKLDQLWNIAQDSIRENKYLRAEKVGRIDFCYRTQRYNKIVIFVLLHPSIAAYQRLSYCND